MIFRNCRKKYIYIYIITRVKNKYDILFIFMKLIFIIFYDFKY